jgi:hypothetical protein
MGDRIDKLRRIAESSNPHEADNARRMLAKLQAKTPPPAPEKLPDPIGMPKFERKEYTPSMDWPPK